MGNQSAECGKWEISPFVTSTPAKIAAVSEIPGKRS
jgi:hypothetical protein